MLYSKKEDLFLLITGSLCAKEEDRTMRRSDLLSVQVYNCGKFTPVQFFNDLGDFGISAFAWHPEKDNILFGSSGDDFFQVCLDSGQLNYFDIPNLKDIHEISIMDQSIWLSNTGLDECVEVDLNSVKEKKRIFLKDFAISKSNSGKVDQEVLYNEKFHCNQIFSSIENEIFALTHHVSGKQLLKRIAKKLLKTHGSGGVIGLKTGKNINLKLDAPHNVRIVNGNYWVCNSGKSKIHVFDKTWNLKSTIKTKGWGRGFDLSNDKSLAFIGISAPRKRYINSSDYKEFTPNMIEVFDTSTEQSIDSFLISGIEQVNNVYVITESQYFKLKALTPTLAK